MNKKLIATFIIIVIIASVLIINNPKVGDNSLIFIQADYSNSDYEVIYFAGGCFWGVQAYFDRILGVIYTEVGYINGKSKETSYSQLENTEHAEAVEVVYDKNTIDLKDLVKYFYDIVDPTEVNRQGPDKGIQYRTGIYYTDKKDLEIIETITNEEQENYSEKIVTEIEPLENYVVAEVTHQNYLDKNPSGYCHINLASIPNEKPRINISNYEKIILKELKDNLSDIQYRVTQQNETEPPFENEYWDYEGKGLYVDVISGEPLFLSVDKYNPGSGWPSFTKPISWEVLTYNYDNELSHQRIEVRSRIADSHLGHVFSDKRYFQSGLRYCINSASLDFIPYEEMDQKGYGKFKVYFE